MKISADWDFSTMRVILTALSVVSAATAAASFDYTPGDLSSGKYFYDSLSLLFAVGVVSMCQSQSLAEFSFVPLDRARRSPVEETPMSDPSSIAATGGASADAAVALSRGFVRDMSEIVANVTDQKLREMTDISDKKLREIAGQRNYTNKGGNETTLGEVCYDE